MLHFDSHGIHVGWTGGGAVLRWIVCKQYYSQLSLHFVKLKTPLVVFSPPFFSNIYAIAPNSQWNAEISFEKLYFV